LVLIAFTRVWHPEGFNLVAVGELRDAHGSLINILVDPERITGVWTFSIGQQQAFPAVREADNVKIAQQFIAGTLCGVNRSP